MSTLLAQVADPQDQYIPLDSIGDHKIRDSIEQPTDPSIRYIPLTQGQFTIVDAHLYEWLSGYLWYAVWNPSGNAFYAKSRIIVDGKAVWIFMHRLIVGSKRGDRRRIDHANQISLDNRGLNLRPANAIKNAQNRGATCLNTSGYKGVSPVKKSGKWLAQITYDGKNHNLGHFIVKEDAARAYDREAIKHFKEYAVTNFPREDYL